MNLVIIVLAISLVIARFFVLPMKKKDIQSIDIWDASPAKQVTGCGDCPHLELFNYWSVTGYFLVECIHPNGE